MINKEKIRKRLLKQLKRKGILQPIKIKRNEKNEFNEPIGEVDICTVEGYYYKGKSGINLNVAVGGEITTKHKEKLLVIYDDKSILVKQYDFFIWKDIKYRIIDLGNNFDVVFDMTLERV